jgi:hypothetical protein
MSDDHNANAPDANSGPLNENPAADVAAPVSQKESKQSGQVVTSSADVMPVSDLMKKEVRAAIKLLDFIVQAGYRNAAGQSLAPEVFAALKSADAKILQSRITVGEWVQFELSYYALAEFASPVTAETLQNTEDTGSETRRSPAQTFALWLLASTIVFGIAVTLSEWGLQRFAPVREGDVDTANSLMQFVKIILPYAYGGLGACVFLLKTAHTAMYQRTFDVRRKPEYFNRILLGAVSGGAIILLINQIAGDDGSVVKISSGALGFIAGYSSDFLFNTLERIINAILPKVGIDTLQRASPAGATAPVPVASVPLADLLKHLKDADDADKPMIRAIIEKQHGVIAKESEKKEQKKTDETDQVDGK